MAEPVSQAEHAAEGAAAPASPLLVRLVAHPYLRQPVTTIDGIGEKRAALFANLGIQTLADLLTHFPRTHQDRSQFARLADAREGDTITVRAEVVKARAVRLRRRLSLAEIALRDASGTARAIWFGQDYLVRVLTPGTTAVFHGAVGKWNGPALRNPEYEIIADDDESQLHVGRIVPVYRLTDGLTQRMVRSAVWNTLLALPGDLGESIPDTLRQRHSWMDIRPALQHVHFPESMDQARDARSRFAYEELLHLQVGIQGTRARRLDEERGIRHAVDGPHLAALRRSLPFELTAAQLSVAEDILRDMASPRPMARLLQGDVGCGKTIVALHAVAAAADGGYQAAVMAPTEILAEQHTRVLRSYLSPLGIEVGLLTGSTADVRILRERIHAGEVPVVAGTHALFQEATNFHRLGLVIVDEQHRFGVMQRHALTRKGINLDLLHMTATPIPRTLAITVYGGMDLSIIDELPPGRKPVKTRRIPESKVADCYGYVCKQAAKGYQTYVVCPLVDESSKRALTSVTRHFATLSEGPLAAVRTGLLHGRMGYDEKEAVMCRFKAGEIDVLFSTTVIEVGVDCPNATTMIIEDAAQFGLTQLHQLRGRVGRGSGQSHCFLLGKPKTPEGRERLDRLCKHNSGFDIAEADLQMRGPGELLGVRQAGISDLRVADLIRDVRLLDLARKDAAELVALESPGPDRKPARRPARK